MPDPAPDLDGPCPDEDFWTRNPLWWPTAVALHRGESYAAAGRRVDRRPSTVSRWVGVWRGRYGPEFLRSPRAGIFNEDDRRLGQEFGGVKAAQVWRDVRAAAAFENARAADLARRLLQRDLRRYIADPDLPLIDPRDLWYLAKAADLLEARADRLEGISEPARAALAAGRVAGTEEVPLGTLDALELEDDDDDEILQKVEEIGRAFVHLVAKDGEIVDDDEYDEDGEDFDDDAPIIEVDARIR